MLRFFPCLALLSLLAPSAWAWDVELASSTGIPAHWETPLITYRVLPNADGVPEESILAAVRNAADAWEELPCHVWTASHQGLPTGDARAIDGENRVLFIQENWEGTPAEVALTYVTRDKNTGRLADTDILVNDALYTLTTFPGADPTSIDLQGLLTHEWGHVMGLAHSLVPGATMQALVENDAHPLRTLTPDDAQGLCSLYEPRPVEDSVTEGSGALAIPHRPLPIQPPALPLVVLLGIGLCILHAPRTRIHLLAMLMASCTHGTPLPGPVDSSETGYGDAADTDETSSDTSAALDLEALLFETPSWEVTEWHSHDQVTEGDVVTATFGTGDSRGLKMQFGVNGELQWIRSGAPWSAQRGCGVRGSWSADGNQLTWSRTTTPLHCPGLGANAIETLEAHLSPANGDLVLTTLSFGWRIGTSGATMRRQRIHLTPAQEFDTGCGIPTPRTNCVLECRSDPTEAPLHLSVALSCAEPFTESECEVSNDEGEMLEFTCRRGCHEVICHHRDGFDDALVCEEVSTGWTCGDASTEGTL